MSTKHKSATLDPDEVLLTPAEVAERLGIKERRVRDLMYHRRLRFVQLAQGRRVRKVWLDEYLNSRTVDPEA